MANVTLDNNNKDKGTNKLSAIIIGIVVLAGIVGMVWLKSNKYAPVLIGSTAPDFTLKDLSGKEHSLSSYRGKVVFVNFWATWCKSCKEEMPSMQTLYQYLKDRDVPFEMLAISMDRVTTQKEVDSFVKSLGITFPVLLDPWGKTDGKYKLTGVPETYIIDTEGRVVEKIIGPRDWTTVGAVEKMFTLLHISTEPAGKTSQENQGG